MSGASHGVLVRSYGLASFTWVLSAASGGQEWSGDKWVVVHTGQGCALPLLVKSSKAKVIVPLDRTLPDLSPPSFLGIPFLGKESQQSLSLPLA